MLVKVSSPPISVTFAGTPVRLAVERKLLSACWADAPRDSSEVGSDFVRSAMREATAAVAALICDWICGGELESRICSGCGRGWTNVEDVDVDIGPSDDDEVGGDGCAKGSGGEDVLELHRDRVCSVFY